MRAAGARGRGGLAALAALTACWAGLPAGDLAAALPASGGWRRWRTPDGVVIDSRSPDWHGRLARRAAAPRPSAPDEERAEFLLVHEARHGRWQFEGWADAMGRRGHTVHALSFDELGDEAPADEAAIAAAAASAGR